MEAILTGLGLSGSTGLNTYLPLLIAAVMGRLEVLKIEEPYDIMTTDPAIALIVVLLLVELVADKIPVLDSVNDVINTALRPLVGAALFGASTSSLEGVDPALLQIGSLLAGGTAAGSTHALKATARPAVTASTGGIGNIVISFVEDAISLVVSLFAVLLPVVVTVFAGSMFMLVGWLLWDIWRTRTYFPQRQQRRPAL